MNTPEISVMVVLGDPMQYKAHCYECNTDLGSVGTGVEASITAKMHSTLVHGTPYPDTGQFLQ
jgi:hypothetical protein